MPLRQKTAPHRPVPLGAAALEGWAADQRVGPCAERAGAARGNEVGLEGQADFGQRVFPGSRGRRTWSLKPRRGEAQECPTGGADCPTGAEPPRERGRGLGPGPPPQCARRCPPDAGLPWGVPGAGSTRSAGPRPRLRGQLCQGLALGCNGLPRNSPPRALACHEHRVAMGEPGSTPRRPAPADSSHHCSAQRSEGINIPPPKFHTLKCSHPETPVFLFNCQKSKWNFIGFGTPREE